jgi:hypothetical protein
MLSAAMPAEAHRLEVSGLGANETVTAACYFRVDGEVERE